MAVHLAEFHVLLSGSDAGVGLREFGACLSSMTERGLLDCSLRGTPPGLRGGEAAASVALAAFRRSTWWRHARSSTSSCYSSCFARTRSTQSVAEWLPLSDARRAHELVQRAAAKGKLELVP